MSVAAVVLAAGSSKRLGRSKQMLVLDEASGEMLVERVVRVALEAGLSPVIVVARPEAEFVAAMCKAGCIVAGNEHADEGMAASIRCGISAAAGVDGVVVMSCDQVAVRAEHLRALCTEPGRVTGSLYAGRVGIPAYFPAAKFTELMRLHGDVGAREILRGAATVEDEMLVLDVDAEADIEYARAFVIKQQS